MVPPGFRLRRKHGTLEIQVTGGASPVLVGLPLFLAVVGWACWLSVGALWSAPVLTLVAAPFVLGMGVIALTQWWLNRQRRLRLRCDDWGVHVSLGTWSQQLTWGAVARHQRGQGACFDGLSEAEWQWLRELARAQVARAEHGAEHPLLALLSLREREG